MSKQLNPTFAGRTVENVYRRMQFTAFDLKVYDVEAYCLVDGIPTIMIKNQSGKPEFLRPLDVLCWQENTKGDYMPVLTPNGKQGKIVVITKKRKCLVELSGKYKSFKESDLREIECKHMI